MTVIVGTRSFIAADRRVTDEGESSSMVKIAKNAFLIAAVAGTGACNVQVKRAIKEGAESPEDLLPYIDGNSYALILTPAGLLQQAQDGVLWACKPVTAIGSGGNLALGYIMGHLAGSRSRKMTATLARKAVSFTGKFRSDCGGGCDLRYF